MVALTRVQRQFVRKQCFFWLFRRIPYLMGSWAVTAACIFAGSYLTESTKWGVWKCGAITIAGLAVLGYAYNRIWIAHWRPEVARFIQLHAAEIEAAASTGGSRQRRG